MNKKEVIDSLRSLHDLSKAINSTLNIEEVVEMIQEKTSYLMRTDRVLILLLDRTKRILSLHSAFGFGREELPVKNFYNIKSFDHCIVHKGTVITMKEILPEDGYRECTAVMPFLSHMVFAPLEIKGEAYGLLGVSDRKRKFSEIELEIFCALGSQAAVAIDNAILHRRVKDAFLHTAAALAEAVNSRDPYTGGHTKRVEEYSLRIADALDLPEEEKENLKLAAILHDIGKIGIDDAILRKGGHLSGEEEAVMKKHPEIGARILSFADEMGDVMPGVCYHHEWFDGSGYPEGLKGEEIPLQARIIGIADAYDALTTNRPYRKVVDQAGALEELTEKGGSQFDPFLIDVFCKTVREEERL
ncbi:MAG: HD domain-containing phosphohydrolase [Thermodesulfobacteriota bacterium]